MNNLQSLIATAFTLFCFGNQAMAQSWPAKPIRVLIEVAAGGTTDVILRQASNDMQPRLGQPLILENRAGANGIIAMEACAKAPPDGYTLCMFAPNGVVWNPHVFNKLPYDPDKDFRPITRMYFQIEAVLAKGTLAANSIQELQAMAVAKPGSLNAGTLGPGSQPDVFRQWLADHWKTQIVGVPYKGGAPVMTALLAGEVDIAQIGLGNAAGVLDGGKIKVFAVGGTRRIKQLPNVPTMTELGMGDAPGGVFWGIGAPTGTPEAIINRMNSEIRRLYLDEKFVALHESRFMEPATTTPEEFDSYLRRQRETAGALARRFNLPKQ
ncbi:MAG: Bug family tripartite tricarboxylate transporter substrate binding protein [Burkholderiales bacterium]